MPKTYNKGHVKTYEKPDYRTLTRIYNLNPYSMEYVWYDENEKCSYSDKGVYYVMFRFLIFFKFQYWGVKDICAYD